LRSVLIVDDDVRLAEMLQDYLVRHEIALTARHDGLRGLEAARTGQYDLMLLDVMLPDIDGLEVLRRLRTVSDMYVLLLSARGEAADRVLGLRLGADDYLPKPFNPEELVARIGAILRRGTARRSSTADAPPRLALDGLSIDLDSHAAFYEGHILELTNIELQLLESFLESPGIVLTREDLMMRVFQRAFHPLDRSLDMYVSRLRRKLRSATPLGERIKTIRSLGYLFSTA
jgi:DNA-binding response OmpR family regulator